MSEFPDSGEYHIASFVVSVQPRHVEMTTNAIESLPGVEVHAAQDGKLVVTAEAGGARELAQVADALNGLDTVHAVAPVYHEYTDQEPSESNENPS